MKNEKNKLDLKKYKGAIIHYMCQNCKTYDEFFEDFNNLTTRIKGSDCSHFSLKFILNYEGGKFKYVISFSCINCNSNKIINLFDENTASIDSYINYKCEKCGEGPVNIGLLLSEEKINIDEENEENDNNEKDNNKNKIQNNYNNINNFRDNRINEQLCRANPQINQQQQIININNMNNFQFNNMMFNAKPYNNMQNNNMFLNNNMIQNNIMFNSNINQNNNMIHNNNNMMINNIFFNNNLNNIMNNNIQKNNKIGNNNEIELIIKDTKGMEYNISSSQDKVFGEVVRKLLNKYKNINKDNISSFLSNGDRIKMQKTLKENNIENKSIITMILKS